MARKIELRLEEEECFVERPPMVPGTNIFGSREKMNVMTFNTHVHWNAGPIWHCTVAEIHIDMSMPW